MVGSGRGPGTMLLFIGEAMVFTRSFWVFREPVYIGTVICAELSIVER